MSRYRGEIAVIGLACAFPGAPNAESFWQRTLHRRDGTPEVIADQDIEATAAEALANAGYLDPAQLRNLRSRAEMILGSTGQGLLPGGIAGRLGLAGPNYTVDAGSASALAAVELAVNDLRNGRCDVVLAGGVHTATPPSEMATSAQTKRPSFAAGMLVLKRFDDAERAGDAVYALIREIATDSNHDLVEGEKAGLNWAPDDPESERQGAAALAEIIEATLTLHHRTLPPADAGKCNFCPNPKARPWIHGSKDEPRQVTVHVRNSGNIQGRLLLEEYTGAHPAANLQREWDAEIFVISGETRTEMLSEAERLLEFISSPSEFSLKDVAWTLNRNEPQPSRLAIVAGSREELQDKLARSIDRLRDESTTRIRAIEGIYYFSQPLTGKLGIVFPGEGSQYTGMLADLCIHFPEVRESFDLIDRAFEGHPDGFPSQAIFPPAEDGEERLNSMDGGATAVFGANQALYALLEKLGIRADAMAGHSIGEHSALLASGLVRAGDEQELIRHIRGVSGVFEDLKNSIGIPNGTLLTISGADHAFLERLVAKSGGELHIALDNCPHQVVVCGPEAAIDGLIREVTDKAAICQKLPFARAYHTPWFDVFTEPLRRYFDNVTIGHSNATVYSSITARRYGNDPDEIRDVIATGWASTVRFRETIEAMYRDGVRIFVEAGPRGNLAGFVDDTLRGKTYVAIPANTAQRSGILQLQHMLAQLVAHGVPVQLQHLYKRRNPSVIGYGGSGTAGREARGMGAVKRAPEPAGAATVMQRHLQTMSRFLEVQQRVMTAYFTPAAHRRVPVEAKPGPFLTEVLDIVPGERARLRHRLSPDRELLLKDHTLGRNISQDDPELRGLSVMPMPVVVEILAEAAAMLQPGKILSGVREFQMHRWITLENPVIIELTAARSGPGSVYATMRESGSGATGPLWAEGSMLFADQYPSAPAAEPLSLANERRSRWTTDRVYADGLCPGPAFQAIKGMGRLGENGATSTLETITRSNLIAGIRQPAFLIDPIILDAAGQTIALWSQEQLDPTGDIFPFRLGALQCYAPPQEAGTRLECRAVTHATDKEVRADIEIVDTTGRVLYRMQQWVGPRIAHTPEFWQLRAVPRDSYVSDLWNEPIAAFRHHGPLICCRLDSITREFCEASGGLWRTVLAHLVLSRRERRAWMEMRAVDKRKHEWLLGRCAAKDAVRLLVERHVGVQLTPADVEIVPDGHGRPRVEGAWTKRLRIQPAISIAHSHGVAVALAALHPGQLVGIDLESLAQDREGFESIAFGADELGLLDGLRQDLRQEWALRMWCAKEALGKALGRGLSVGMQAFHINGAEIDTGAVELELRDGALKDFPQLRGKPMIAYTAREMDFVFSTIIYQQGAVQ